MRILPAILLFAILIPASARETSFEWPDSNSYARVLVNVNEYIESRPPAWFEKDKLITDLAVSDPNAQTHDAAVQRYEKIRRGLESRGISVGTYISGTTVLPKSGQTKYPWSTVSLEDMPAEARYVGSWPGQGNRKIIDVSDASTRHGFQAAIKRLWEQNPAPVRFVDNAAVHSSAGREQSWADYCMNIREIRILAASLGSKAIFNISMHVGMLSDSDAQQLIEAVGDGGIALEMPWHPFVQKSPLETKKAVQRYRQLLDSGIAIIMIPVKIDEQALVNWVRSWKKPADHLYISGVFWKQPDPDLYKLGR
jgi:hypothetical protein